ncbi:MAG: PLP-dependent transferase [Armatimonadetes bacterium]|nr:PLP-dependent transferase [Armatimonadota bacterium]
MTDPELCFLESDNYPYRAIVPPIVQSSLFTWDDLEQFLKRGELEGWDYTRVGNPTIDVAERIIAQAEGAEKCMLFASGMAAVSAAVLACVKSGDHVVAVETCYGPTREFLTDYLSRFGVTVEFVSGEYPEKFRKPAKLYYLESPSSIFFNLQDIQQVAAVAKETGALVVIDNSWATPLYQNPISMGVDLVIHSTSKYLGGHSDIMGGAVAGRRELMEKVGVERRTLGGCADPFAAYLLIRGLRTLPVRMARHQETGLALASALAERPYVDAVNHPGLESHPQFELGKRQMRGYSGLFSFWLKPASRESVVRAINSLRRFRIGPSWGGPESLVVAFPEEQPPHRWVVRLSVGLEPASALLDDLDAAFDGFGA